MKLLSLCMGLAINGVMEYAGIERNASLGSGLRAELTSTIVLVLPYREMSRLTATVSSLEAGERRMSTSSEVSMVPCMSTASIASLNISAPVEMVSSANHEANRYDRPSSVASGLKLTEGWSFSRPRRALFAAAAASDGSISASPLASSLSSSPQVRLNCFRNESTSSPEFSLLSGLSSSSNSASSLSLIAPSSVFPMPTFEMFSSSSSSSFCRLSLTSKILAADLTALPSLTKMSALPMPPLPLRLKFSASWQQNSTDWMSSYMFGPCRTSKDGRRMSTCNNRRLGWASRAAEMDWEAAPAAEAADVGTSPIVPTFHDDSRRERMVSTLVRPPSSSSSCSLSEDEDGDDDRTVGGRFLACRPF
mmetsp:Transcript_30251/g.88479  ORF Transcript_30251/g.88479 Transcript_30251/m.88479 type:complete len:364 (-) Transcript_30251:151-1242(-)